jgi:5'-nucleotidase
VAQRAFILGVDLDGVCADHSAAFRNVVAEEFGVDPASLPLQRSWGFSEWGMVEGDFERLHRIAVLQKRMFRDMPVVRGAAEALWRLSDAGIWIRIITHRLYVNWGHAIAISDTAHWLDTHRLPYRDLCFLGAKPEVEADMYIDDAPHNIESLRGLGNDVIVFDQPYNTDLPGPRASSWADVEELVIDAASRAGGIQTTFPGIDAGVSRLDARRSAPVEGQEPRSATVESSPPLLEEP